jgi:hypothetical protein
MFARDCAAPAPEMAKPEASIIHRLVSGPIVHSSLDVIVGGYDVDRALVAELFVRAQRSVSFGFVLPNTPNRCTLA